MEFLFIVFMLGVAGVFIASVWRIFEKAGQPGWAVIVPIYNLLVLLRIVGKPWWWLFLMIIPYVGLIWSIWTTNLLSKKFGKDEGFTVGLILLPVIFYPLLAFGDAQYQGHQPAASGASDILDADMVK
ncbi:MAG: hypothetical protein RLY31_1474 [Bacteroidota bacterium]|jgi:hypothetical protein